MTNQELGKLFRKYRNGCNASGSKLFDVLQSKIFSYLKKRGVFLQDAEDITQTILANIVEKRDTFDTSRPFGPWLWIICRNELFNHFRHIQRKSSKEVMFDEEFDEKPAQLFDPMKRIELKQRLESLPDQARDLIISVRALGYRYEDLNKNNSDSISALKSRASRAMKTHLEEYAA